MFVVQLTRPAMPRSLYFFKTRTAAAKFLNSKLAEYVENQVYIRSEHYGNWVRGLYNKMNLDGFTYQSAFESGEWRLMHYTEGTLVNSCDI